MRLEEENLILRDDHMITIKTRGDFRKTETFLRNARDLKLISLIKRYATEGVTALSTATPVDTGETASAWDYRITASQNGIRIDWINTNSENGVPVVILIQYGHGTSTGGYVQGYDFINPALKPIFDKFLSGLTEEVRRL